MKVFLSSVVILGSLSLSAHAKVKLNKPVECHTVVDVISEVVQGKEQNTAVLYCKMDPKDMNSTEEVTVKLTTQAQVTILTSLYTANRPYFKGDPLVAVGTIVESKAGGYLLKKLHLSTESLD